MANAYLPKICKLIYVYGVYTEIVFGYPITIILCYNLSGVQKSRLANVQVTASNIHFYHMY